MVKQAGLMNGREIKVQILHPPNNKQQEQQQQQHEKENATRVNLWRDVIFNLQDKTASFYRFFFYHKQTFF